MMRAVLSAADIWALALRAGMEPTDDRLGELAKGAQFLAVMLTDLEGNIGPGVEPAVTFAAGRPR